MRTGILGGTFDPVHYGHLSVAEEARHRLQLDRVLFLPAGRPWLRDGQALTAADHRVEMVRLAVASNPHFEVWVDEIERPGPTYTIDTLRNLEAGLGPKSSLYFILGSDAMAQFHRWKEPERLLEIARWVVVKRPGYPDFDVAGLAGKYPSAAQAVNLLPVTAMGVSGTEVRRRAAAGISLRYLVPDAVADYISQEGIYDDVGFQGEGNGAMADDAPGSSCPCARLLELALERGALKYGRFTLSSGRHSDYYFDGRLISLDPEGIQLIAQAMLPLLRLAGVDAIGGLTLGADPIVAAISLASGLEGNGIPGFIVRKETKSHGTSQSIEGPLPEGARVAIVDDVCTSGGSLFQAIAAAESAGCTVVKVVAILDRMEGGSQELRRRGYDFVPLLAANAEGKIAVVSPDLGE